MKKYCVFNIMSSHRDTIIALYRNIANLKSQDKINRDVLEYATKNMLRHFVLNEQRWR